MVRRYAVGVLACLAAVPLLLAGCAEKHEASQTLPPATSAPTSPTLAQLGPADFPVPDNARRHDPTGAENALRYFLALITHQAAKSGAPLRDLSRGCSLCTFLADRFDRDAAAGYAYKGGAITVDELSAPALHDEVAEFAFTSSQAPIAVLDSDGKPVPGRGEAAIVGLNSSASMTWSEQQRAWFINQLHFSSP